MNTLSYTISPLLQQTLKEIEVLRQSIILYPLSQGLQLRLNWEANIIRIYYSLHLAHSPVTEKEIVRILTAPGRQITQQSDKEIANYKRALDYISREWLVSDKPVMPQAIQTIYRIISDDKTHLPENNLMEMLVFLQTSRENPLIQAFIAYVQFGMLLPITDISGKVARLLPYLFLYKAGLDFRGLLVLEGYFYRNERLLREMQIAIEKKESISVWIEHFISEIANQLQEILKSLSQLQNTDDSLRFFTMTERQKEILTTFDQPGARITNKKVQQFFRISQITASRDLAKLSALGLLFPYGKGRSVYYTRA
jgi:Fic family protein